MRLMQAEQNIFHSRRSCIFGLRSLLLVVRCSACINLWPLSAILEPSKEMKKLSKVNLLLVIVIHFLIFGCEKEKITNHSVLGNWNWVKTYYGFTNFYDTPKTTGLKRELSFDDYYFSEFINNILVKREQYDLIIKKDTIITNMYLKFESGFEQNISFSGDTLLLFNWLGEGSLEYYIRK